MDAPIAAGWKDDPPDGAYVFAEYSGDGRLVGVTFRASDGRKGAPAGSSRGLIVPADLHQRPDPVLVVEGASDVAAACALGLTAVGRPSNRAGADDLAVMLDGRVVIVVGERDGKPGGAWPGRDGAKAVARRLAGRWEEAVRWTLPPQDTKDLREWLRAALTQLQLASTRALRFDELSLARCSLLVAGAFLCCHVSKITGEDLRANAESPDRISYSVMAVDATPEP
jgi:hypothetical protein